MAQALADWLHRRPHLAARHGDALAVLLAAVAWPDQGSGEGVLSLSRAFLRAGARGTIATLWPVGPPAADLMARFYPRLAAGEPPAEALAAAKRELRRGRWGHPLYWAPFVLVSQSP